MALVVPGIEGKPIAARDFTRRIRGLPGLIGWYSLCEEAQMPGVPVMVPRAGAANLEARGTIRYAAEGRHQFAQFTGDTSFWQTPALPAPAPMVISVVSAFTAAEGFTEPWSLVFSNGDRLWLKPNHNAGGTGIEYFPATGSGGSQQVGQPLALNTPVYNITVIDVLSGRVRSQSLGGQTFTASTALLTNLAAVTTAQLVIGMGRTVQPFVGRIMEAAWFAGDILDHDPTLAVITEYMAATYGA